MELFKKNNKEYMQSFEHQILQKKNEEENVPPTEQERHLPEDAVEQHRVEEHAKRIDEFLAQEKTTRDERAQETTLHKVIGRRVIAAAAAGLFLFGAAERTHGAQEPHPATTVQKEWTTHDDEQDTLRPLKEVLPEPPTLRSELAQIAKDLENLKNDEHRNPLEDMLSVSLPADISFTLTMDQIEVLSAQITDARVKAARQLFNPSGTTEHPEKAYRRATTESAEKTPVIPPVEERIADIKSTLREQIHSLLPEKTIRAVSPKSLADFLEDMSDIAKELSYYDWNRQYLLEKEQRGSIVAGIGASPYNLDDGAGTLLGIRISGDLNNLPSDALSEAFNKEINLIKKNPLEKVATELLGWAITR